jgi:hypothetical protein
MAGLRTRSGWLVAVSLLCIVQARGETQLSEYQVKAAFLYKFATYVRWPATSSAEMDAPFVIGIIGKDPFGHMLDAVIDSQSIHGRAVVVKRLVRPEEALRCHLLFVGSSERGALRKILGTLNGAPVLTVGDMDRFAEQGGMINLTTEENHIRFEINKRAIDRAGLKVASQLLGLARIVDEEKVP